LTISSGFAADTIHAYESLVDGIQHTALVKGNVAGAANVLVRVHSECLTGDLFGSMRCDCGRQLDGALSRIAAEGRGVVVYLRGHEGRGIGIGHKVRAYQLQDQGRDTLQANLELGLPGDGRDYSVGAQIVADLGITSMRLMTNNPAKYEGIAELGLTISERVPLITEPTIDNVQYLRTKQAKMGHQLGFSRDATARSIQRWPRLHGVIEIAGVNRVPRALAKRRIGCLQGRRYATVRSCSTLRTFYCLFSFTREVVLGSTFGPSPH
jgi:GTP cyclohydrolase II